MPNLYIDPFVFACPPLAQGQEAFEGYVSGIISWEMLGDASWASVYISAETYDTLFATNSYPLWDDLEAAINAFGINYIQPQDIVSIVNGLLNRLPKVEEAVGVKEILVKPKKCEPSDFLLGRPEAFVEQYWRFVILICLLVEFRKLNEAEQVFLTRLLGDDCIRSYIQGEIVDCEYFDHVDTRNVPRDIEGDLLLCSSPHGLYLSIDPSSVWSEAARQEDYQLATYMFIYRKNHGAGVTTPNMDELSWSYGSQFFETARRLGFTHEEGKIRSLLRACAETILNERLDATHWIRTGKGANNPQVRRGNDRAWRRDIDAEYHLHYWETERGPEFASVVPHNDFSIPE